MKVKLLIALVNVAVLCAAVVDCSYLKGGEEGGSAPPPIPAPAPEPKVGEVSKAQYGNTTSLTGILSGANDSNKFNISTNSDLVEVEFDWPEDTYFYVKVLGAAGDEQGDFDLSESEVIELTGGGKFTLVVYSRGGGGCWTATYTD